MKELCGDIPQKEKRDVLIHRGDFIFLRNNSLLSRTIRLVETGKFDQDVPSHVAIACETTADDIILIEASCGSVRMNLLSRYKGCKIWVKRMKDPKDVEKGLEWARLQIGTKYDYFQLIGILLRGFFRLFGPKVYEKSKRVKNFLDSKCQFICSEFGEIYAEKAKERLWPTANIGEVTPYDLFRSPILDDVLIMGG